MIPELTIAISVKNEERNLPNCLYAIGKDFASHIIVIDSGSSDKTQDIARAFGASVINFVWDGNFPKKRNWFLRNHAPQTKWVLFLDADEYLTPEFKSELLRSLKETLKVGYWLNYTRYFMGKKLRGGYPLKKLALFRIDAGEYEQIDEERWSSLDMEVHEHPILAGEVGTLKSKIDHQDFRDLENHIKKHNEYAAWEAARFIKTFGNSRIDSKFTWKQKLKYKLMPSVFLGPAYFLGSFFLLGGFIDGAKGLAFAIFKMSYFTQVYCKIQEHKIHKRVQSVS